MPSVYNVQTAGELRGVVTSKHSLPVQEVTLFIVLACGESFFVSLSESKLRQDHCQRVTMATSRMKTSHHWTTCWTTAKYQRC
jgi:hypothetical protein